MPGYIEAKTIAITGGSDRTGRQPTLLMAGPAWPMAEMAANRADG